jgi:hypothetical protein
MSKHLSSQRAEAREAAARRRSEKREWRESLLDLVAAGHPYEKIAAGAGVSVSTVRREVKRAIDQRPPPEPAETFVALQQQRLNKAMQYADLALERGDLRAVSAVVALLPHIERYWRLQHALHPARSSAEGAQVSAINALKSLGAETELPPLGAAPASC